MAKLAEERGKLGESQSISRAAALLRHVADHPGASLGEIAKGTGLPRSTVQRLVGALNSEGLLTKNFGQQGVFLGMELARLGGRVALDARVLLRPQMEELHSRIGDNIDLTVLDQGRAIVIEQIVSNEEIRVISYVGKQHPFHCTANGKAHLGQLSREEALQVLGDHLPAMTAKTITDPQALLTQVEAFRQIGLYIDREEYGIDACAVATTLPEIGGRKLAIGIAMPSSRFARREEEIKTALLDFRRNVQRNFGNSI